MGRSQGTLASIGAVVVTMLATLAIVIACGSQSVAPTEPPEVCVPDTAEGPTVFVTDTFTVTDTIPGPVPDLLPITNFALEDNQGNPVGATFTYNVGELLTVIITAPEADQLGVVAYINATEPNLSAGAWFQRGPLFQMEIAGAGSFIVEFYAVALDGERPTMLGDPLRVEFVEVGGSPSSVPALSAR